jgi:AraC-like DNA-binding protein
MLEKVPKIYQYQRIVQAKLFIDNHFHDEINLRNVADEACFSKFHFIRLFKIIYRSTPHQYLKQVRIENAKLFLQKGVSVTDTCFQVGFDSVTSFAALFKNQTNLSPSIYRQQWRKRQEQIKEYPLQFIPNCFAEKKGWTQESNFEDAF